MKVRQWAYQKWTQMSPLVRTGLAACLLLGSMALLLRALGASWVNIAFAVGPLTIGVLLVAAEPRLHWLTRPKPKLVLAVRNAEEGRLTSHGLPPWPLAIQRIVENEVAEALATIRDREALPSWLSNTGMGLMSRPTPEDHERAKENFKSEVQEYEGHLRMWLSEYSEAATARWETFAVSLNLSNSTGAVHADAVEVVLDLPEGVRRASAESQIDGPPIRPTYRPPQPRSLMPSHISAWDHSPTVITPLDRGLDIKSIAGLRSPRPEWDESDDGQRLTASRVDLQPGRTVEVAEPLFLRARGHGVHEVNWTIYSQSLDRPLQGTFELVVPRGDSERPPFGRVEGILRFPDIPIVVDDDEADDDESTDIAVHPVRVSDPPLNPPCSDDDESDDIATALRAASQRWQWEALGLDPTLDGPASNRVEVRKARPSAPAED